MADLGRMTIEELVSKVLADEHGDWLREAVAFLAGPGRHERPEGARLEAVDPVHGLRLAPEAERTEGSRLLRKTVTTPLQGVRPGSDPVARA